MTCIHCNGTGRCSFCHGSGKSGMLDCIHCNGTGVCSFCGGRSSSRGGSSSGRSSFNRGNQISSNRRRPTRNRGGFDDDFDDDDDFGNFGSSGGEDAFARSKRLTKEAINKLYSKNPMERKEGLRMLNSQDCHFDRANAFQPAVEIYFNETDPEIKAGLLQIIAAYNKTKDYRVMKIFENALSDPYVDNQITGITGLSKFPENDHMVIPKIQEVFNRTDLKNSKRNGIMDIIGRSHSLSQNLLGLVIGELNSQSWLVRRKAKSTTQKIQKQGINVVGFLVELLSKGSSSEKLNACIAIGNMGKKATGSVQALTSALSDNDPAVRGKAAWSLTQMKKGAAPAEEALRKATEDESPAVSKMALKALKNIKKISKEEKEKIKEMEKEEEEMKKWVSKYKNYFTPKSEEQDGNGTQIKNRFFMSHALEDFKWVEKAMKVIESWPGCEVWTCERDIPVAGDWMESIYDGLDNCNWYVLFWSEFAENSNYTNDEMKEAKSRNVTSGKPRITIVNLGMEEWPKYIHTSQGSKVLNDADLENWLNLLKAQIKF